MSDLVEHLYRGPSGMLANTVDLILQDDRTGVLAPITDTPTRLVLTLTPRSGAAAGVVDSSAEGYTQGPPGGGADTFQWTAASGKLVLFLAGKALASFPAGTYDAVLRWYDAQRPAGLRMPTAGQRLMLVIE